MKYIFGFLLLVHGLIHLMGFVKGFQLAEISQLTQSISKPMGVLWLFATILFLFSFFLFLFKKEWWFFLVIGAVIISQILIIIYWKEAKFATVANIIILIPAIIGFATYNFENTYKKEISNSISITNFTEDIITQKDIDSLPPIIQKYLNYVGILGKPKVHNVKIIFVGVMRDRGKDWFSFTSEQYNFFDSTTRLFFMKAKVKGLPTNGYHAYKKEAATMLIKVLSLFTVVDIKEETMYLTETVTFFNDLCLFAPSCLIDKRIKWEAIDDVSIKATFTNNETSITAILYFNKKGQLVNFISNDRYSVSEMKTFPFSTPVKNYENSNGYNLPTYGEAIWNYPDGEFVYGKFNLKRIEYNVFK